MERDGERNFWRYWSKTEKGRESEREREREREGRDRGSGGEAGEIKRGKRIQTDKQTDRRTSRLADRQLDRQTERHRQVGRGFHFINLVWFISGLPR